MRGLLLSVTAALALSGCDNWPLYLNLPDPDVPIPTPTEHDYAEDPEASDDEVQAAGELTAPAILTITGEVDSCGYDAEAEEYTWPEHPVDENGDGQPDGFASLSGWYTGDVDQYGFDAATDGWLEVSLEWDNAPPGDSNAPWQPGDPEGDWATESDLDFVVLDGLIIVSDGGVGRDYPETSPQVLYVAEGESRTVIVGCHHEVPTAYTLSLHLRAP